jgi:hypothetical protein
MKKSTLIILYLSLFLLSACVQVIKPSANNYSQLSLSSVWDLPIKYPVGSTFSLSPKYVKGASLDSKDIDVIYQLYANAISEGLSQRGYRRVEHNASVDFYVGFGVALSKDLSDKNISDKFGVTPGLSENALFEKGSFLIYVEDAKSNQRVWRGAVQGFVQENFNSAERKERTEAVVKMILLQFFK